MKNRLLVLFCLSPLLSAAQIVVTPNGVLSISQGTTLYAAGDFTNNGNVLNNGSLNIAGAWTNAGTYNAESGEVTFNGTATQTINHNAQSFARLVISGGGEKLFNADITITQQLSLTSGLLLTNNHSKIILAETAVVAGGSATSYVQGPVYTTGTGSKTYPIGINAHYLPLTFTDIKGTAPVIGVEVIEPNPDSKIGDELSAVSALRFWQVTTQSGSFTGSPVTLTLAGETFANTDKITIAQANSLNDPFASLGNGTVAGDELNGTVTSEDAATMSILAAAELKGGDTGIRVLNAITPNGDGVHDFLKIENIESYPSNEVSIVSRWGDKVFSITGYNNDDKRFNGDGNTGGAKSLSDGTYYYVIDKHNGEKKISGFIILKR